MGTNPQRPGECLRIDHGLSRLTKTPLIRAS